MALHKVQVVVLPRAVLLDPEGETIGQAAHRIGFTAIKGVRAGRAFILEIEAERSEEALSYAGELAQRLLHNPVVETYEVSLLSTAKK